MPKPMAPPMALRVRDLSQNAQGFGTELPIVRDSDHRSWMEFLDIPTDPKYRATLRLYGPGADPHRVDVSVFSESTAWWSLISPPPPWPAYAFVSVTNNETQQVTTVTPKP